MLPWQKKNTPNPTSLALNNIFGRTQAEQNKAAAEAAKAKGKKESANELAARLAQVSLGEGAPSSSSQAAAASSSSSSQAAPPIKPLSEEEIMEQAARWEAENNAWRARGKERFRARQALAAAANQGLTPQQLARRSIQQRANLEEFKSKALEKQREQMMSSPYPGYMELAFPGYQNRNAARVMTLEAVRQAKEERNKNERARIAKEQANRMYPGLKGKPPLDIKLSYRKNRKQHSTRKQRKSTRKNRK